MHGELTPTYLSLVLLAEHRNIFRAIGSMSLIRSLLNEGRRKEKKEGGGKRRKNTDDEEKNFV
jgi:hypothetical protein